MKNIKFIDSSNQEIEISLGGPGGISISIKNDDYTYTDPVTQSKIYPSIQVSDNQAKMLVAGINEFIESER